MKTLYIRNKLLPLAVALLTLPAALTGILKPEIYSTVANTELIPGILSQDIVSGIVAITILALVFCIRKHGLKTSVLVTGMLGYLFYAYGIFVIERFYNQLYPVYMAILGISFYGIIFEISGMQKSRGMDIQVSRFIRNMSIGFLLLNVFLFYPLWFSQLLPLIQTGEKIEFFYSVYILDMCFILPAFIIVTIKAFQNNTLGLLLVPALLLKSFTLLLSVAIGAIINPAVHPGEMLLYLTLSLIFLTLMVLYFRSLKIDMAD